MSGDNDSMTGTDTSPKYYTPTYGLPRYADTNVEAEPTAQRNWRAPGSGAGRLQWEALPERDTPYPWEIQRPVEEWRRSTTAELPDGPLPAAPAPMAPPPPAAPLPPVQIEVTTAPTPAPVVPHQAASVAPQHAAPTATGRIPYAKDAPAGASQPFRTVDRRASHAPPAPATREPHHRGLDFPPPQGPPARRSGTVSPNAKKGKLPFISILTPLLVFIDPAAALVPLVAAMVLIAMSKQYRNSSSRIAWGVVVIVLTVVFLIIRAVATF